MTTDPAPHELPDDVLLVHGAGLAPDLFSPLTQELGAARCRTPLRVGYRPGTQPGTTFEALVDDVAALCRPTTVYVGLSGGATLGVALALRLAAVNDTPTPSRPAIAPQRIEAPVHVIVHEPLVGPLMAELHHTILQRADALAATPGPDAAARFVEGLVGAEVWGALPASARAFVHAHHDTVRAEAPLFARFAPSAEHLAAVDVPLTVTVGARSSDARHAAAEVLARTCGAEVVEIPDSDHLAPWQSPSVYADTIRRVVRRNP